MNRVRWGDKVDAQVGGGLSITRVFATIAQAQEPVERANLEVVEVVEQDEGAELEMELPDWLR